MTYVNSLLSPRKFGGSELATLNWRSLMKTGSAMHLSFHCEQPRSWGDPDGLYPLDKAYPQGHHVKIKHFQGVGISTFPNGLTFNSDVKLPDGFGLKIVYCGNFLWTYHSPFNQRSNSVVLLLANWMDWSCCPSWIISSTDSTISMPKKLCTSRISIWRDDLFNQ